MKKFIMNSKKKKKIICEMSRLKSTGQVKAAASDWWHAVSRAEFEQSHDFQSQCAASRVVATLGEGYIRTSSDSKIHQAADVRNLLMVPSGALGEASR